MGFFKKIGASLKKATKQISFKNLVKVATPLMGAIPIAGSFLQGTVENLSAAHQAKKDGRAAEAEALKQQVLDNVGVVAGGVLEKASVPFGEALVEGVYNGLSGGVKNAAAKSAASMADLTLKAWFTKHWKHILMAVGGIVALVIIWKKFLSNPKGSRVAKRR
jgi:hypothetical protein